MAFVGMYTAAPSSNTPVEGFAMTQIASWLKEALITFGLCLLLMVAIVLGAVLVRPLLIVAFIAMLGVAVLSIFSPRVRAWVRSPAQH
jgi:hypothetical protein